MHGAGRDHRAGVDMPAARAEQVGANKVKRVKFVDNAGMHSAVIPVVCASGAEAKFKFSTRESGSPSMGSKSKVQPQQEGCEEAQVDQRAGAEELASECKIAVIKPNMMNGFLHLN